MGVFKVSECDWCGLQEKVEFERLSATLPATWSRCDDEVLCPECVRSRTGALAEVRRRRRSGVAVTFEQTVVREGELRSVLAPLVTIADAYDANALDDEARKRWGRDEEHENETPPDQIELYAGRGGKELLTLAHCLRAREVSRQ